MLQNALGGWKVGGWWISPDRGIWTRLCMLYMLHKLMTLYYIYRLSDKNGLGGWKVGRGWLKSPVQGILTRHWDMYAIYAIYMLDNLMTMLVRCLSVLVQIARCRTRTQWFCPTTFRPTIFHFQVKNAALFPQIFINFCRRQIVIKVIIPTYESYRHPPFDTHPFPWISL